MTGEKQKVLDVLNELLNCVKIHKTSLTAFVGGDSAKLLELEEKHPEVSIVQHNNGWGVTPITYTNTVLQLLIGDGLSFVVDSEGILVKALWTSQVEFGVEEGLI